MTSLGINLSSVLFFLLQLNMIIKFYDNIKNLVSGKGKLERGLNDKQHVFSLPDQIGLVLMVCLKQSVLCHFGFIFVAHLLLMEDTKYQL